MSRKKIYFLKFSHRVAYRGTCYLSNVPPLLGSSQCHIAKAVVVIEVMRQGITIPNLQYTSMYSGISFESIACRRCKYQIYGEHRALDQCRSCIHESVWKEGTRCTRKSQPLQCLGSWHSRILFLVQGWFEWAQKPIKLHVGRDWLDENVIWKDMIKVCGTHLTDPECILQLYPLINYLFHVVMLLGKPIN